MLDFLNQLEGKASIWEDMANSRFESRQRNIQRYPRHPNARYDVHTQLSHLATTGTGLRSAFRTGHTAVAGGCVLQPS